VDETVAADSGSGRPRVLVSTEARVHFDQVDAFGIVYFARYWDWYHHAFEQLLSDLGHALPDLLREGLGFPAVHADIDYRGMLYLGDLVRCHLTITRVGRRSITLAGTFVDDAGRQLAEATTVHVAVLKDGSSAELPQWLRQAAP
jgi:YbgC/YbaW family acyl-CoA thioester hydrolase